MEGTPAQDVNLIFRTPKMYEILEVKQVFPNIAPAMADKISPQEFIIPLGTVTGQGTKILVRIEGVERPAGLSVRAIKPELRYTRNGETVTEELPADANAFVKWVTRPQRDSAARLRRGALSGRRRGREASGGGLRGAGVGRHQPCHRAAFRCAARGGEDAARSPPRSFRRSSTRRPVKPQGAGGLDRGEDRQAACRADGATCATKTGRIQ